MIRGFKVMDKSELPKMKGNPIVPHLPERSTSKAAGYDICTLSDGWIMPGQTIVCRTGLTSYMQDGEVLYLYGRSGMAFKHGVRLVNCTAVIDADYKGEILVGLRNDGNEAYHVQFGDKVAQAVFMTFALADGDKANNERTGGFGSTGR